MATQIDEDYLPSGLKSVLKTSMPVGMVKVQGSYSKQGAPDDPIAQRSA